MNEMVEIDKDTELMLALKWLPQPRTDYQLEKFVVGRHETEEMRYAHCVLNIRIKYNALRRSKIALEKIDFQIEQLKVKAEDMGDKLSEFKWREKVIDKEEAEGAVLGAIRELSALYKIWNTFEKKYTREEINAVQEIYWKKRLSKQAENDLLATGRVSKGNLESLSHIGMTANPQLDHVREVEQKFLEVGNISVLIAVATKDKAIDNLPCLEGVWESIPDVIQRKKYNCYGRSTAEAYNDIALQFLNDGADLLYIIEDDTFPPHDAFTRLYEHIKQGKKAVGAWYPKKQDKHEGSAIIVREGKREYLNDDGGVHEVYTLPMGCVLYTAEVFRKTTFPYFVTTDCLTQDSFFSQKLRDAGFKLYCDTSIRCKHIDRVTSKVYE